MSLILVGVDTSKGYADFHFENEAGSRLSPSGRFDDTPAGHAMVRHFFASLAAGDPDVSFRIGIECTGGLERNWLRGFAALPHSTQLYRLNPLAVRKFLDRELHRNISDPLSAQGLAQYLRSGLRKADRPYELDLEGARTLYRLTTSLLDRSTQVQNELHSLLPSVHPDLVSFCREGFPQWVLRLLIQTPTVVCLGRADATTLARIPYLTAARAQRLITAAQRSIASLRDPAIATVVKTLAKEALRLHEEIAALKRQITRELAADPTVVLLRTIPSIGAWTAACLRLEYGSFERFATPAAVVAFAGLDPCLHQSGDGEFHLGISRRGRSHIRAALYMAALTAIRVNPPIAAFYQRLTQRGKLHGVAMCACMVKLLHIAYACVKTGRPFDPDYHRTRPPQPAPAPAAAPSSAPSPASAAVGSLSAPVTRREARRRRAALAPQTGDARRLRGREAAEGHDNTSQGSRQRRAEAGSPRLGSASAGRLVG
jgi:transposase